ncbi:cysteine peptidase family C39 domain-containing protein [Myxococcus qinghaiensis]|uniref:cysteine peptidase family C39 domain-containing protein n=1 Tax=Myxococcus qinghaiensis TaxID=2906758 RepID=UPI0020A788E6|nr:cysteine peptidase family C39 domain-containing protein [Myxococcus qinghaiensis]MCP3168328.1 cysteine peptidase family C39 domain-containing protein [Myxococcus qinghaiensis]
MMIGAWERHLHVAEPSLYLPSIDLKVPSVETLDDAKAQPDARHTNDIGQSSGSSKSALTSLLTKASESFDMNSEMVPCGPHLGCHASKAFVGSQLDSMLNASAAYDMYAPVSKLAAASFAINEFIPFVSAGESYLETKSACGNGETGRCVVGAGKTAFYTLSSGLSVYSMGRSGAGLAKGLRTPSTSLPRRLNINLGPAGASAKAAGKPGAMVAQLTKNTCGPASGVQLLKEAGIEAHQSNLTSGWFRGLKPDYLADNLNKFQPGWQGMMAYPTELQFRGVASRGSFIARIGSQPGHFVIVDKVSKNTVFFRDPAGGVSRQMNFAKFLDIVSGLVFR